MVGIYEKSWMGAFLSAFDQTEPRLNLNTRTVGLMT